MFETVKIQKLVHGGQGLAVMSDGRKIFAWNALPGETVKVRITKKRKDYCEGIADEIIDRSAQRIDPTDDAYLSTSPWQIMTYEAENTYKQQILEEAFARENVKLPHIDFIAEDQTLHYRNKMEYSFWADETGLHLALFHRGSHGKRIVRGSSIARPEIDKTANRVLDILNDNEIRGSQLKTIVLRCDKNGNTVVALFVKDEEFPDLPDLKSACKGIEVCYSTPRSPASVKTKVLYVYGDISLVDDIVGKNVCYDVHSFFQVNLPIFQKALARISENISTKDEMTDLYCGVGTIGLAVGGAKTYVDIDPDNCTYARRNVDTGAEVVQASSEQALDYVQSENVLIVDPPRAGLHAKLVERIIKTRPPKIFYLSCNPSTQARDIALLQDEYKLEFVEGYNFFPRTPHIECLAVMIKK